MNDKVHQQPVSIHGENSKYIAGSTTLRCQGMLANHLQCKNPVVTGTLYCKLPNHAAQAKANTQETNLPVNETNPSS